MKKIFSILSLLSILLPKYCFSNATAEKILTINGIGGFECQCSREMGSDKASMEVMIVGLAGSPTLEDYKNMKVENSDTILIKQENGDVIAKFVLMPKKCISLNTNDYVAVYEMR